MIKLEFNKHQITRNLDIFTRLMNGESYLDVSYHYDITPTRSQQIFRAVKKMLDKLYGNPDKDDILGSTDTARANVKHYKTALKHFKTTGKK